MSKTIFRADIEGLRAIAILAVVFYHADYGWASGGFVGVDVFFVISGYLVTRNILHELHLRKFSFYSFYIKRVRRLFPAFFVTLVLSFIAGCILLSPSDLERFATSLSYSLLSLSNFFFWKEASYFNLDAVLKPLLHTWALSVEVQFYLVWPLLLFALSIFKKELFVRFFFIIAAVVSLGFSSLIIADHPEAAFFLLPFRIFEFAAGSLCVFADRLKLNNKYFAELAACIGLILILWTMRSYTRETVFPGYHAIIPCIGAAFIIYAGQSSIVGSVLKNKLLVKLGGLSYSVYLIHWPIFVFYKYYSFNPITEFERISLIFASLISGYFLWKYIEKPFRDIPDISKRPDYSLCWAPSCSLILLFLASNVWGYNGWQWRFPKEFFLSNDEIMSERKRYWQDVSQQDTSFLQGTAKHKNIIFMGNSHAIDIMYALRSNGFNYNITFLPTSHVCYNFGTPVSESNIKSCSSRKKENFKNEAWTAADAVFLHDHWPKVASNQLVDTVDLESFLTEVRALTDAPVYVFGPKMVYRSAIPNIVHSHMRLSSMNDYGRKFQRVDFRAGTNQALKHLLDVEKYEKKKIYYVDVLRTQCGEDYDNCDIISKINSKFLYFDREHLTAQGAKEFGQQLKLEHPYLFAL